MTLGMPDWASEIPSAPVHQESRGELVRPFTAQQLLQIGGELIEQFIKRVVLALAGFFIPGDLGAAFEQLKAWGDRVGAMFSNLAALFGIEDTDLDGDIDVHDVWQTVVNTFIQPLLDLFDAIGDGINAILGPIFGGIDLKDPPTPGEVWQTVIDTLMLPLNLLLGPGSALNAANLFGRIGMPQLAGGVSLADLTTATSNLLDPFTADSVPTSDGWSFNSGQDAAQVVADGSTKGLWLKSGVIKVEEGQPVNTTVKVKYSGISSGSGQAIRYVLETYESEDGSGPMVPVVVGSITNPTGTISSPVTLGDTSWDIPVGVQSVRPLLEVDEAVTAGTVYWVNTPVFRKTLLGVLSDGLPAALQKPLDDLQATWDKFKGAAGGTVDDIEDALNDAGQAIRDALANALGHAGTGHTSANLLSYFQAIPQTVVSGLGDLNTLTNQIRDILAGLVVTPINSTVQAIKDWFTGVVGKTQNLTTGGNLPQTAVSGLADALGEFSDNFTEMLNGVTTGTWNPASSINDLISALFGTKQKTNQIIEDLETGWTGGTPSGTPTPVYDTIAEIRDAVNGVYTVEVKTTSGTWTNPGGITEFWAICIGSGDAGGRGGATASGIFSYGGGGRDASPSNRVGASGGKYIAQQINPADLTSTVSYTVPAGGTPAGSTGPVIGGAGAPAVFGAYVSSDISTNGSISSLLGFYDANSSGPGVGGLGGNVNTSDAAFKGTDGANTPLAVGGTGGAPGGSSGSAGGNASLTGQTRCGGAGGGGGGGNATGTAGGGGAGGFPGGGGGGGGAARSGNTPGLGGNGANGAIVLIYR